MRILIISPYPPHRDGLAGYAAHLRQGLTANGDAVAVVSVRPSDRAEVLGCLVRDGVDRLVTLAAAWGPDVVHVQHTIAGFGGTLRRLWMLVARLRAGIGAPTVVTHHEITRDTGRTGAIGKAYYRRIARHADLVHVHTGKAAALHDSLQLDSPPATVLAHPVAPLPFSTLTPDDLRARFGLDSRPIVLCFGFIHVDKGLDAAVRAVAGLRGKGFSAQLVSAGEVRRRPLSLKPFEYIDRRHLMSVQRLAAILEVSMTVTGYVPDGEVRSWFDAAALVLLPYRRAEQSGVAQLAIASGARILAAPTGGLVDLFAGTPSLMDGVEPATIADALARGLYSTSRDLCGSTRPATTFAEVRSLYHHAAGPLTASDRL